MISRNVVMNEAQQHEMFSFTARVLGALFYFSPESKQASPLVTALTTTTDWCKDWPLPQESLQPLVETLKSGWEEPLADAWQRLFIGPWALPAPPWGSVWLDRDNVIFGDSTLALRQWMREKGITFERQQNEPEDHFGTLLMLAAWFSENNRYTERDQLLAWHLLPWSKQFLCAFIEKAQHPFYMVVAKLALLTLAHWQSELPIPVPSEKVVSRG